MISIPVKIIQNRILNLKEKIDCCAAIAAGELGDLKRKTTNPDEAEYLHNLIIYIDDIVTATPEKLQEYKKNEFKYLPSVITKEFKDKVIDALGYKKLRSTFFPEFFQGIGIKACVYCNAHLTVAVDSEEDLKKIIKAKFQLDHYVSKAEYPCFSISLFNLYPVCGSCNLVKSVKEIQFDLYSNNDSDTIISKNKFRFGTASFAKYLLSRNIDEIELVFTEPNIKQGEKGPLQNTFDIQGIYETQKDLAEELILKSIIYTDTYKKQLVQDFKNIFTSASLSNRLLTGNYIEPENIHKRPMAKFMQDIAMQLGLTI